MLEFGLAMSVVGRSAKVISRDIRVGEEKVSARKLQAEFLASSHPIFCTRYASLTTIGEVFQLDTVPYIAFTAKQSREDQDISSIQIHHSLHQR
jgi:hypothetical protein